MWPKGFLAELVDRGFQVVCVDNNDSGLSTHLTGYDGPRRSRPPRYTLRDIAADVVVVMDALGCDSAHVCGASQGGVFAQAVATYHPDRVRSPTSISGAPGVSLWLTRPRIRTVLGIVRAGRRKPRDRDAEGQKWYDVARAMQPGDYPADAIPGARFVSYPGMGHDLPRALYAAVAEEIATVAQRAEAS